MPSNKKIEEFQGCDNAFEHFEIRLINEKSQLCPIAPNFFWWFLGSQKALRVIGLAQNSPISSPLGVVAKKHHFQAKTSKTGKYGYFLAITSKW